MTVVYLRNVYTKKNFQMINNKKKKFRASKKIMKLQSNAFRPPDLKAQSK